MDVNTRPANSSSSKHNTINGSTISLYFILISGNSPSLYLRTLFYTNFSNPSYVDD